MKSLALDSQITPNIFPKLKPGVNFFKKEGDLKNFGAFVYVGFNHRGIELNSQLAPYLLQHLTGLMSLEIIYQEIGLMVTSQSEVQMSALRREIDEILSVLYRGEFIELRNLKIETFIDGEFAPINLVNSRNRLRAEENLYSWHPAVSIDRSAESIIESRRNFSIIIFGRNRLAISLFSILQASGFSQIKIIDRSISPAAAAAIQIAPDEVCGLAIRGSDVGVRKSLVIADLARNSQLFPDQQLNFPAIPDFIISTEVAPQETIQRWMSELIPHLAISKLIENSIEIGPIVLPGRSPCLNCLSLWRSEQFPHHKEFELISALDGSQIKSLELPSAQVALLSGYIAIHLIEFEANQNSSELNASRLNASRLNASRLIGATQRINLFDPLNPERTNNPDNQFRYWQPHISCGCQQLI